MVFIVSLWELLCYANVINKFILPPPHVIAKSLSLLIMTGDLLNHLLNSIFRVGIGFLLSIIIGIPFGMILYEYKFLNYLFSPLLSFIKPIPPIAWMPLSLLFFGIGNGPAFFLTFISSFGPLAFSTYWALKDISSDHLDVGKCFQLNLVNRWRYILIPAALPKILDSVRLAFSLSWMAVVAAEMISAKNGLGFLITSAQDTLRSDIVIIGMISIGFLGYLFDWLMKILILKLFPWKMYDRN
jgi:ABC-type nitrate/sulfonate/bicarbonate transport system permease component